MDNSGKGRSGICDQSVRSRSAEFQQLWEGVDVNCEFLVPADPPPWLDQQLYQRGLKFVNDNYVGIVMSNGEALVSGLCIPSFYKALLFSGQTNAKRAALVRYRDTAFHIFGKWYSSNPWEHDSESNTSLRTVTTMHKRVADKMRNAGDDFEEIVRSKSEPIEEQDQAEILFADLFQLRLQSGGTFPEYEYFVNNKLKFTQFDMMLVQIAFFGGVLLYPEWYGCNGSDEELRGFLHVWRVFGYYLGITDRFNGAQFDVEVCRRLGYELLELIIKPSCLNIDYQSIYLGQKIFKEPTNYYVLIYRNYWMTGLELDQLWKSFTWKQCSCYYLRFWFSSYIYPWFGMKQVFNKIMLTSLNAFLEKFKKKD